MRAWENYIRKVVPYVPGEQPQGKNIIKLNTNENPYPPSPAVAKALKEIEPEEFRKYSDPSADMLVDALADYYCLPKEQVFVGVGSDDVLGMAFLTFFNSSKPVLFPDVTYSFYPVWAKLYGISYETPKLDEAFQIRIEDYKRENGGIVIANPNAPTGIYLPLEQIEEIVKENQDVVVIIDEAYIDFGGESARSLIDKYENLLVVQTFSKSRAMAGMRIGYAMGSKTLIKALQDVKYSYNSYTMNMPSIILGAEAVKDDGYFKDIVGRIVKVRETAKKKFAELGFSGTDSQTNFLFITHEKVPAAEIFEALKRKQIYVRYFSAPRLDNYLRVTIGTEEDMEVMYEFLNDYLKVAVL
ncbi:MAG: histidinol-phosphate transaminase [Hungatella sp.]|nr:histidinol-phosphate transaminase [Hungatella sp.]